jgi:hypothetical protein
MVIACSPDIFHAKMSKLMVALEFIRTYIDDLLCTTKGSVDDDIMSLRQVLIRVRHTGLKVNAKKCSFCATETEYLGYVLTREGIKPQPKMVQGIIALTPPQNVKQLRRFLGMVQYSEISGHNVMKCSPHSTTWLESVGTAKLLRLTTQNESHGIGTVCIRLI